MFHKFPVAKGIHKLFLLRGSLNRLYNISKLYVKIILTRAVLTFMIPLVDFARLYRQDSAEYIKAARRVFQGGQFILGEHVRAFEKQFADYLGIREAVGVASGTDAISLALMAAGVGSGDG